MGNVLSSISDGGNEFSLIPSVLTYLGNFYNEYMRLQTMQLE